MWRYCVKQRLRVLAGDNVKKNYGQTTWSTKQSHKRLSLQSHCSQLQCCSGLQHDKEEKVNNRATQTDSGVYFSNMLSQAARPACDHILSLLPTLTPTECYTKKCRHSVQQSNSTLTNSLNSPTKNIIMCQTERWTSCLFCQLLFMWLRLNL